LCIIVIENADFEKIGAVMGGPVFQEVGALVWEMDPATDMKFTQDKPPGPIADMAAVLTAKDGCTPQKYYDCFWAHGDEKELTVKENIFEMDATRREMCDESKSRIWQSLKNPQELMISCYGCDMAKIGALMGGPLSLH
jgi:hypothetical protein